MGAASNPGEPPRGGAPPPLRVLVARPRVDEFLDQVPTTPVSLVVAPAGSGKTTAVAAWSQRQADRSTGVTWIRGEQVERLDQLLEEARTRGSGTAPPVLVIDDAHLLPHTAADALSSALADDPAALRLLLLGRTQPSFVPVSVALAGHERSLRVDDLRFPSDEAAALVRAHHPEATPAEVAAVLEESEGWAAALVLGAYALRTAPDSADPRATLAAGRQPVLDYLAHEVLDTLPPELQHVLLTTCQEDVVTAAGAELLSGLPNAVQVLDRAVSSGQMVTGGAGAWHYHPLLIDVLRQRTAPTGPEWTTVVEAHHRATEGYVERRDAPLAVRHARLTGDVELQLRVLREFAGELLSRGRGDVLAEALEVIPADVRGRHPELLVLQATLLRSQHRVDAAKRATDRALLTDARNIRGGLPRDVEAQLAVLELWQARYGWREPTAAIARAERALGCRHDGPSGEDSHDLVGVAPVTAAWTMLELAALQTWRGDLDRASVHVQDAELYSGAVGLPVLDRAVLAHRAVLEMTAGTIQGAMRAAEASLALWEGGGARADLASARAHLVLGWGRFHELDLVGAAVCLDALDHLPGDALDPFLVAYRALLRAGTLTASGEVEEARRTTDALQATGRLPAYAERHHRIIRLLADGYLGDLQGMRTEAAALRATGWAADADLGEALALGLGGDEREALRRVERMLTGPSNPGTTGAAITRTALLLRMGTPETVAAAERSVPDVLGRVAPQRLLWILAMGVLVTPAFTELLVRHADGPDPHPFARQAAAALSAHVRPYGDVTPHRHDAGDGNGTGPALLTPREQEVLRQLALGGSNADLARSLFVSDNTVKTHLASIYRKLDVDRRVDALREARVRGLL
jgi:LuxR family maltose regulon positive regulatory protein